MDIFQVYTLVVRISRPVVCILCTSTCNMILSNMLSSHVPVCRRWNVSHRSLERPTAHSSTSHTCQCATPWRRSEEKSWNRIAHIIGHWTRRDDTSMTVTEQEMTAVLRMQTPPIGNDRSSTKSRYSRKVMCQSIGYHRQALPSNRAGTLQSLDQIYRTKDDAF